ncbi:MAG: hypothetical protein SGJ18_03220 [Pseudomonadota bacterium]|nr:hypothetical protein [Pseudomonadota bacterium]
MITGRSYSERRKAGRYLPADQKNYDLFIDGKKIGSEKMIDIGPDGLKVFSPRFNAFKDNIRYKVEFKSGTKVHFETVAIVSWRLNLKFPINTCLIGFQIQDINHEVAKFWVGKGYRKGFAMALENNLGRFKIFHNLLMSISTRRKFKQFMATYFPI